MRLENGEFCPLVNGPCKKWDCKFWIQLRGVNPQTGEEIDDWNCTCLLYTSPSPRDATLSRMPSSA